MLTLVLRPNLTPNYINLPLRDEYIACLYVQVGPLSQAIRAVACLSLGQNITAKSVHRTSLYPTALTFECFTSLCLYLKHVGVNLEVFGGLNWVFIFLL